MAIYDAPAQFFDAVWNDELTAAGARGMLYNDLILTPSEKESFQDRLKDRFGGDNPLTRATIGVVTNPLFLFLAVMAPSAGTALKVGRSRIMDVADGMLPWQRSDMGVIGGTLQKTGLLGPNIVARRTMTEAIMHSTSRRAEQLQDELGGILEEPMNRLAQQLGLPRGTILSRNNSRVLDPDQLREVTAFEDLAWIHLNGRDKVTTSRTLQNGKIIEDTLQPLISGASARDRIAARFGSAGTDLVDAMRAGLDRRAVQMFAKDDLIEAGLGKITRASEVDEQKIIRLTELVPDYKEYGGDQLRQLGKDILDTSVGGSDSLDAEALVKLLVDDYFPRNRFDRVGEGSRITSYDVNVADAIRGTAAGAKSPAIARQARQSLINPHDLQSIRNTVGGDVTPAFQEEVQRSLSVRSGQVVQRVEVGESINKYNRQTQALKNLYLDPLDNSSVARGLEQGGEEAVYMMRGGEFIRDSAGNKVVANNATGLANEYLRTANAENGDPYFMKMISHFVFPTIAGRYRPSNGLLFHAKMNIKAGLTKVLGQGPLGELIESIPGQEGFRQRANALLSADNGLDDAATRMLYRQQNDNHFMARYLYSAHLGFNLGSVLLNLTQPFLLGATHLGNRNIVGAYKDALAEMGNYQRVRASQGWRKLHRHDHEKIIREAFPHHDLTDIAPDTLESIDAIAFRASRSGVAGKSGIMNELIDRSLGPFTNAEWLNRSVVFHATRRAYEAAGHGGDITRLRRNPNFVEDVRAMVDETQFAPNLGNTPLAFQTAEQGLTPFGSVLNNSLMRMFITFPLRSATAILGPFSSQVGGGTRTIRGLGDFDLGGAARVFDFVRMASISAAGYEVAKELIGSDISRALAVEATLGIIPGTDDRYEAPIPPVVDIPYQTIKALIGDDAELLNRQLYRALPGGIAARRIINISPDLRTPVLQGEYADYSAEDAEGNVPVYDKNSRQLLRYANKRALWADAFGVDFDRFETQEKYDRYLLQQQQQIREYKNRFKVAIIEGNTAKAEAIRAEFQKRFKLPLTVTQQEISTKQEQLSTPRRENTLSRFSDTEEPFYRQYINEQDPAQAAAAQQRAAQDAARPFPQ